MVSACRGCKFVFDEYNILDNKLLHFMQNNMPNVKARHGWCQSCYNKLVKKYEAYIKKVPAENTSASSVTYLSNTTSNTAATSSNSESIDSHDRLVFKTPLTKKAKELHSMINEDIVGRDRLHRIKRKQSELTLRENIQPNEQESEPTSSEIATSTESTEAFNIDISSSPDITISNTTAISKPSSPKKKKKAPSTKTVLIAGTSSRTVKAIPIAGASRTPKIVSIAGPSSSRTVETVSIAGPSRLYEYDYPDSEVFDQDSDLFDPGVRNPTIQPLIRLRKGPIERPFRSINTAHIYGG